MTTPLLTLAIDAHPDGLIYGASQRAILPLVSWHEGRAAGLQRRAPMRVQVDGFDRTYVTRYDRITGGWLLRAV